MAGMGHTHPALALRIYAAAMRRDDDENERLRELVDGAASGLESERRSSRLAAGV
jgi:hypothetical protein